MKGMKGARLAGLVILVTTMLLAGGCGYKNPPVPPESVVPKPISDLRYTVDSKGVELTWSYPVETIRGTTVKQVDSFELYRAVVPMEDYCGNCPIPFGEPFGLPGGESYEENRRKSVYQESLLRSGHKYFYKVRSRTSWWASSGDSNIVSFIYHTPAKAPEGLNVTAEGTTLALSWKPVTTFLDGSKIDLPVRYRVLRSRGGEAFKALGRVLKGTEYVDSDVAKGHKYFYKVQSMLLIEGDLAKGGMSKVVDIVPQDVTPPSAVTGVTAVRTGTGIKVIWDRSRDADVAGYRVYRRIENQKAAILLGEAEAAYTIFVDDNVPENIRVYYSVTAVDQAEPANESLRSEEATVRH